MTRRTVRGTMRALGYREGSSGQLTGDIVGLYQGYRFGSDGAAEDLADIETAHGTLALALRQATDVRLPTRPDRHPFDGRDPIAEIRAQAVEPAPAGARARLEVPVMTIELSVRTGACTGIFVGASGTTAVDAPQHRVGGSMMVATADGHLWLDFLEKAHGPTLAADLWVDGERSTGAWRGSVGDLTFSLTLHQALLETGIVGFAEGTYEGEVTGPHVTGSAA